MAFEVLALVLAIALVVYGFHPLKRYKYRHIPGPPPTWMVGNLLPIMKLGFPQAMQKWAAEYGGVFKIFQGGVVLVVVEDPAAVHRVDMKNHSRPHMLSSFSGKEREHDYKGILLADGGPYWMALRQSWQALFHPSSIRDYVGLMNGSAERLVGVLAQKAKAGEVVEMWRLFGCLTMEVVGSAAFGLELRTLGPNAEVISAEDRDLDMVAATATAEDPAADGANIQQAAAVIFGFAGVRSSLWLLIPLLFPETGPVARLLTTHLPDAAIRKVLKARHLMRRICNRLTDDAQQRIELEAATQQAAGATAIADSKPARKKVGSLPAGGFLTHLLKADNPLIGRPFTRMEITMQAYTFLLAGYETTASALAFTVYHVAANHAKVEAKLLAEVDDFGCSTVPTYDDLAKFPYLNAVWLEALRLSPPGALGTIRLACEAQDVGGYGIPEGTSLITAMYSHQRNSKYWLDAETFRPERFLDTGAARNPAYAPFGEREGYGLSPTLQGGRSCVGRRFAEVEAKITLIRLYQNFTLRLEPDQIPLKIETKLTMAPAKGVTVTVHPRTAG